MGQHEAGAAGGARSITASGRSVTSASTPAGGSGNSCGRGRRSSAAAAAAAPGHAPARGRHARHRTAARSAALAKRRPRSASEPASSAHRHGVRRSVDMAAAALADGRAQRQLEHAPACRRRQQLAGAGDRLPIRAAPPPIVPWQASAGHQHRRAGLAGRAALGRGDRRPAPPARRRQQVAQLRATAPGSCGTLAQRLDRVQHPLGRGRRIEPRAELVVGDAGDGVGQRMQHRDRPASAAARPPPWSGRWCPRGSGPGPAGATLKMRGRSPQAGIL